MLFSETPLSGCYVIEPERMQDHRGFFARAWCQKELEQRGLKAEVLQSNVGLEPSKRHLAGVALSTSTACGSEDCSVYQEGMFDVVVDLRPASPTHKRWFSVELTEDNGKMIYVSEGVAQGYMTLADNTEMNYHTSGFFNRESASGVRYDDPAFSINWPIEASVISEQDAKWPNYGNAGKI